jgi:SRSO17 transposase
MSEPIETAPVMELTAQDLAHLVEEWCDYHAIDSPVFQRREQREWAGKSLHGLLLEMPRQSIEPMVLALEGANGKAVRTMPWFSSDGAWEDDTILQRHGQEVDHALGEDDGVLTLAGRDFLQPGQESVGVQRQDWGAVGQRANGQAGVCLGSASHTGSTLVDRRLSRPQEGVEEEASAERRRQGGVPVALACTPKPTLGGERLQAVPAAGTLRGRWVTWDAACGRDTACLAQVAGLGLWDFAAVPHETQGWQQRPATAVPAWAGRGRQPTRARLGAGTAAAHTVGAVAESLPAAPWSRQTSTEGRQGPLVADLAALRVIAVREGLPGPEVWLVRRRNVLTGELQTSLRNAPADTLLTTRVRLSGRRWPIATGVADGTQDVGRGDDAVRSGRGWHHHLTLCILAHCFLVRAGRR